MRWLAMLVAAIVFPISAGAQNAYPMSIGVAAGWIGDGMQNFHALGLFEIRPVRSPLGLRLDGMWRPQQRHYNNDFLTAISASAIVTVPSWRVAPYLLFGYTRTNAYSHRSANGLGVAVTPAVTDVTGGAGVAVRLGGTKLFAELRQLKSTGVPLSLGVKF